MSAEGTKQLTDFQPTGAVANSDIFYSANVNTEVEQKTTALQIQQYVQAPIANGTLNDVGTLDGIETIPLGKSGLFQTTLRKIASFVIGSMATSQQSIPVLTDGQSAYVTNGYTPGIVNVFVAGVRLNPSRYQALDGVNIVITDPTVLARLVAGMTVDIDAATSINTTNAATVASVQALVPTNQPAVGTLTGVELVSVSQGSGLYQGSLSTIAGYVLSTFKIAFASGAGAATRTLIAKLRDRPISPKDFGAKGDGATDDSAAIMSADTAARTIGTALYFPAGTYLGFGLTPTVPWVSDSAAVIKNNNPIAGTNAGFVTATSASGISTWECEGLTFDGSASADPSGGWTSANYDSFLGSSGLICYGLSSVKLRRVKARNAANGAGIRIDSCTSGTLDDITTTRSRGKFGDGIYITNSSFIKLGKHSVSDYTRIGVVSEQGSYEIDISDGTANNGHDGSILYGGTEYNSGYWSENTGSVRRSRCVSSNNAHYGFTNTTGTVPNYTLPIANHSDNQCEAYSNGLIGFLGMSVAGLPINLRRDMCASYGAPQPFVDEALNDTDSFINSKCHADFPVTGTGVVQIGFQWGSSNSFTRYPLFQYEGCTTRYSTLVQSDLDNSASNNADYSCFAGGVARVRIIACHQADSTKPIYIKQRTGSLDLMLDSVSYVPLTLTNVVGKMRVINSSMAGSSATNPSIVGPADFESIGSSYANTLLLAVTGNIKVTGGQIKPPTSGYFWISRTLSVTRPAVEFDGVRIEKDIAAGNYAIRIQEEGTVKPMTLFRACTFFNAGVATALNPFVWNVRAGTPIGYSGCFTDSTVTNFAMTVAALGNPTFGLTIVNWTAGTSVDGSTNGVPMGGTTPLLGVVVNTSYAMQWGTQAYLYSDAANTLSMRNGTNGQTVYAYGTYTDSSNWERGVFAVSGGVTIGTQQAGTGVARGLFFMTGGTNRWQLFSSGSALAPITDAGSSLGASGQSILHLWMKGVQVNPAATSVPTTGTTVTVGNTTNCQIINPAGSLAALTVQFPTPLADGHTFEMTITQAITTLTLTPSAGATILGGFTSTAGYTTSKWKYVLASTTWFKVGG